MSIPPYTPSGGYVPPSAQFGQQRSGPGCWVWGLGTCLVVVVIVAIVVASAFYSYTKSSEGKKLVSSLHSAFGQTTKLGPALAKMRTVHDAIVRYHERNGVYPADLKALLPDYLDSASELHTDLDPNPDPSHVSFTYTKPKPDAPSTTTVLSFHWIYSLDIGVQKQSIDTEMDMLLNGSTEQNQTQTATVESPSGSPTGETPPKTISIESSTHISPDGKITVTTHGLPSPGSP